MRRRRALGGQLLYLIAFISIAICVNYIKTLTYLSINSNLHRNQIIHHNTVVSYSSGSLESYFRDNHYNASGIEGKIFYQIGCPIWREEAASPKYQELQTYIDELRLYMEIVENFTISYNLRDQMFKNNDYNSRNAICSQVELHADGLEGIFTSKQLSKSSTVGYMEPLLPPLRHPLVCYDNPDIYNYWLKAKRLLDLTFIVHDFSHLCRKKLQPHSRIVLIDMGASLEFHRKVRVSIVLSCAVCLIKVSVVLGALFDLVYLYVLLCNSHVLTYVTIVFLSCSFTLNG